MSPLGDGHGGMAADGERDSGGEPRPRIRRARFQRLTIYEVEESELSILERGSLDSIFLNVAIALLAMSVSLSSTLLTAEFASDRAWTLFLVITVAGYIAGLIMVLVWWRGRVSVSACARTIRQRLPTESLDDFGD